MVGANQYLNGSHDLTTHFQKWFAIRGLACAKINTCTKFEVSASTRYEGMKGDTKCRKWVVWGLLHVSVWC